VGEGKGGAGSEKGKAKPLPRLVSLDQENPMGAYLSRRLMLTAISLLGVLAITFIISHVIPGDPARVVAGRWATEEQIQAVRKELGLDRPVLLQFVRYLNDLLRGNLGKSIVSQRPIVDELKDYFPPTLELVLFAMLVNVSLAVPLGVLSAVKRGGILDMASRLFAVFGAAAPVFWVGLIMQIIFYGIFHILPLGGRLSILTAPPLRITGMYVFDSLVTGNWRTLADALAHLIMPALTLGFSFVAVVARIVRSSMLEVLNTDYVRTARAKGLPEKSVVYRHALRNALLPPLTVMGMQLGWMMGGTVLIETVFSWGGLGFWAVTAIRQNDFPVIMAVTLIISLTFIVANFLVDLMYLILDPRIRY